MRWEISATSVTEHGLDDGDSSSDRDACLRNYIQTDSGTHSEGIKRRKREPEHSYPVQRVKLCGATGPNTTPSNVFMAWSLIKNSDNFTSHLKGQHSLKVDVKYS